MLNVIDVLEEVGQDARLRNATNDSLEAVLLHHGVDAAMASAALSRNQVQLERALGVNANICCVQHPNDDEDSEDQPQDAPADDDASIRYAS